MAEQTLNIPQLVVFIIVSVLAIRWYLSKPAANGTLPQPASQRNITPAQIDQVAQMFPQLDRRQIAWDLQRNGGNVSATTEKVLSGRGLDLPPPTFDPPLPRSNQTSRTATPAAKPSQPDLITRYNLSSKLNAAPEASSSDNAVQQQKSWSADKNERQANLQRRREEMILAARRKLEEKEKAKATGSSS